MEHEHPPEFEAEPTLDRLPEALGFRETEELRAIRRQLTGADPLEPETAKELRARYQSLAQEVVAQEADETTVRIDIGLTVQMALIERDSGANREQVLDTLYDAAEYASQMGLDDLVASIQAARAAIKAEG